MVIEIRQLHSIRRVHRTRNARENIELTGCVAAVRLSLATVNAEIDMPDTSAFAIVASISMHHLHRLRIAAIQTISNARLDERTGRIET